MSFMVLHALMHTLYAWIHTWWITHFEQTHTLLVIIVIMYLIAVLLLETDTFPPRILTDNKVCAQDRDLNLQKLLFTGVCLRVSRDKQSERDTFRLKWYMTKTWGRKFKHLRRGFRDQQQIAHCSSIEELKVMKMAAKADWMFLDTECPSQLTVA